MFILWVLRKRYTPTFMATLQWYILEARKHQSSKVVLQVAFNKEGRWGGARQEWKLNKRPTMFSGLNGELRRDSLFIIFQIYAYYFSLWFFLSTRNLQALEESAVYSVFQSSNTSLNSTDLILQFVCNYKERPLGGPGLFPNKEGSKAEWKFSTVGSNPENWPLLWLKHVNITKSNQEGKGSQ